MNLATISLAYLKARSLNTLLNILLLALGVATIVLLLLATTQLDQRMRRDAQGIDLVVGAKGSPMPYKQALEISKHRMVKKAIPLALGDSYKGARIVGTTPDYLAHYDAKFASGKRWEKPLEVVIGAEVAQRTGLALGAKFHGSHGLGDAGEAHEEHPYVVVGILERAGTVLDRLVICSVESVWAMHASHLEIKDISDIANAMKEEDKEYTALLLQYASPIAAAMLPRYINNNSAMQAASPAYETARLFSIIGVGVDVLRGFALVLVFSAGLSVFIALYNALNERRYDLAVMRTLGARPLTLMLLLLFEGLLLALIGGVLGLLLGHVLAEVLGYALKAAQQVSVTGWTWVHTEWWVLALATGVGIIAALIPAWRAYRTDIAGTLARG
jgi:putative ABC transport system permease protein